MEEVITLAPGEERIIRIVCSGGSNNTNSESSNEVAVAPENLKGGNIEMANQRKNRKNGATRKNRKNNVATRKNRKQSGGNSYMNFAKQERSRVLADHPEMKSRVVDVAKEIGKRWRSLSESERKKYEH